MKNRKIIKNITLLSMLLFLTSISFAQSETESKKVAQNFESENELAKVVFKTIQNGDSDAFLTYCATEDRMKKLINGMGVSTPMEKEIKQELKEEKAENFINGAIMGFNSVLEEAKRDSINMKNGEFPELVFNEIRFEITNLKCSKIKFKISFGKKSYVIRLDIFKTNDDIFIYDLKYNTDGIM